MRIRSRSAAFIDSNPRNGRTAPQTVRHAVAAAIVAFGIATSVRAEGLATKPYQIPSQPVSSALKAFAAQSDMQLIYSESDVGRVQVTGINGNLAPRDALSTLLRGTDLEFEFTANNVIVVRKASGPSAERTSSLSQPAPLRLAQTGEAQSSQNASVDSPDSLEEIVVRGVEFRDDAVSSANKMNLSVKDTPQTVKVITPDLADFANVTKFQDFYKLDATSGPSHSGDQYPSRNSFYRGASITTLTVDGFRIPPFFQLDLAPFERFEVVKGSASTIYGQSSIGGVQSAITKQPKKDFGATVSLEAGSYDHYRADVDVTGPLNDDRSLTFRAVAAYLDEDEYIDFASDRRIVLAPSLKYEFNENTSLLTRVYYQNSDFNPYTGFGAQFDGTSYFIPDVSRHRAGNSPQNTATKDSLIASTQLEHRMGQWTLRGSAQYGNIKKDNDGVLMFGTDENGFTDAVLYHYDIDASAYLGEVNLFGNVEAFGREHTLFFGADYSAWDFDYSNPSTYVPGSVSGFSILNPDYDLLTLPTSEAGYADPFLATERHRRWGVTAQTRLQATDRLSALLGLRYSHSKRDSRSGGAALGAVSTLDDNAVTYQTGLTYAITPRLNGYGSYGTTFEPQAGFVADGKAIDPQEGKVAELGIKGELLKRRFSYSLALFRTELSNLPESLAGTPYLTPIGTQESKGIELEFQGELARGWQVYGSIASMKAEYTKGVYKGIQPPNAPKFGVSLFSSYEIPEGLLRGLGFGGGVVHKAKRDTTDLRSGTPIDFLSDFTEVELRLFYSRAQWDFDLGVSNAFDELYYSAPNSRLNFGYMSNPPRTIRGRIRYRF